MSHWQDLNIEDKVFQILRDIPNVAPEHHLGCPFLTAYQIAIEFAQRHPDDFELLDLPIGGADIGQHNSLAQYLANQLSININAGILTRIEGGLLSNQHIKELSFHNDAAIIHSSLTSIGFTLSIFRLR
jgi:hypothetical protein